MRKEDKYNINSAIENKNILIFIDWFTPAYKAGGPIKSVSNIVNSLYENFNFFIITSDRDIGDLEPFKEIYLNQWLENKNYKIAYLSKEKRSSFIHKNLEKDEFSYIYFNSLYSKNYTLSPLKIITKLNLNTKVIIAPRGMLGEGALKIKPLKKKVFLTITKGIGFFKKVIWHATDTEEVKDIKLIFGKGVKIVQAPNISIIKINKKQLKKNKEEVRLVFFSRISPKKNLMYAIERLNDFKTEKVFLDIYGSIEDASYWNQCQDFININKLNVHYKRELHPDEVNHTLSQYHFLLFPTFHENYGHVIVEALTAGCGLIISTKTPWRNLKRINIGRDIELTAKVEFNAVINAALNLNQEEYNTVRNNCYEFIKTEIEIQDAVQLTKKLFSS